MINVTMGIFSYPLYKGVKYGRKTTKSKKV